MSDDHTAEPRVYSMTLSKFVEADFGKCPGIENHEVGDKWGYWVLQENLTLQFKPGTPYEIELDLEQIRTERDALDWIAYLMERENISREDLGDFVWALNMCIPFRYKLLHANEPYEIRTECPWI